MTGDTSFPAEVTAVQEIPGVATVLDAVCRTTGVSFAAIAHVTESRWIACAVEDHADFGIIPGSRLPIEQTLCRDVRDACAPVVIDNVIAASGGYQHQILGSFGVRSYISVPITLPDGQFFGTLCGFSREYCEVGSKKTREIFRLFAELIGYNLQSLGRLHQSEAALEDEQELGSHREKFIAVLIHELRNPLTAIVSGLRLLERRPERLAELVPQIRRVAARMDNLIHTTLDFTEIRFGSGLILDRKTADSPCDALNQIIEEIRTAFPEADIRSELECGAQVSCDIVRLSQVLANLLQNAVTYGTPGAPIIVQTVSRASEFELSVTNEGEPIAPETIRGMFRPFRRGHADDKQRGLGLGLYIASEIAHAHGGTLRVETTGRLTRFIFCMPAHPPVGKVDGALPD